MRMSEKDFSRLTAEPTKKKGSNTKRTPQKKKEYVQPESQVLKECLILLEMFGIFAYRSNAGVGLRDGRPIRSAPKGAPDITAILPSTSYSPAGIYCGIECKTKKGKLSEDQLRFKEVIEKHGGVYLVARSADELAELLSGIGVLRRNNETR